MKKLISVQSFALFSTLFVLNSCLYNDKRSSDDLARKIKQTSIETGRICSMNEGELASMGIAPRTPKLSSENKIQLVDAKIILQQTPTNDKIEALFRESIKRGKFKKNENAQAKRFLLTWGEFQGRCLYTYELIRAILEVSDHADDKELVLNYLKKEGTDYLTPLIMRAVILKDLASDQERVVKDLDQFISEAEELLKEYKKIQLDYRRSFVVMANSQIDEMKKSLEYSRKIEQILARVQIN